MHGKKIDGWLKKRFFEKWRGRVAGRGSRGQKFVRRRKNVGKMPLQSPKKISISR
jgi:hypothetical protein